MFAQTFQASFIVRDQATYEVQSLMVIWGIRSQILGADLLEGFPTPCQNIEHEPSEGLQRDTSLLTGKV